jgi:ABC-2 type transport system permease protein
MTAVVIERGGGRTRMYVRAFWGLMLRDARVLAREFIPFLLRTIMNPLLFTFVFTYVFPKIGAGISPGGNTNVSFATVIAPGLVAVAIFFQGIAAVALPLATELGGTREIEDRVMAPLPVSMVALEKVVWSSLQSIIAAAAVLPMVLLVSAEPVSVTVASWPMLIAVVLLAAFVAGYLGLVIGTVVKPKQIGLIFSLVVVPVTFLGCTYYPWAQLTNIRWLQIFTLINPLVYVCEGLRIALTPSIKHMPAAAVILALLVLLAALAYLGTRLFIRRVID